jgi:tetratricopeptide (TPR) repeat protein
MMASDLPEPSASASPPDTSITAPEPGPVSAPTQPELGTLRESAFLYGVDRLLALGTILLGFALASFAVRNADFWLHLASGRLLAKGQYQFGKDPFSYVGGDRTWVNHSWLADLLTYTAYRQLGEPAVVVIKAGLIAGLTLLLLRSCTSSRNRWLNVVCVALALLSCAPWLSLQPLLLSITFMGVTLFLLLRAPVSGAPGRSSWKWALAVGAAFWLWSNCDQWFFLGPLTLAFFTLGTFIDGRDPSSGGGQTTPSLTALVRALAIGVIACMLNPHHVHVWRLPVEMLPGNTADLLASDPQFAPLFNPLLDRATLDLDGSAGGNPVNAVAFLALLALNVLGFAWGRGACSRGLLLVNAGLLALAFSHARALPFFAVVAAPSAAINLGAGIETLRRRPMTSSNLRLLNLARVAMRALLVLAGLTALAACYPGWLHPLDEQRRLAWKVEPNATLTTVAERLQKWRSDGKLPPDAHGLILSADLADYCAWFAPGEKTYFDSRLGFHEPEVETYARLRKQFVHKPNESLPQHSNDGAEFMSEQGVTHVVLGSNDPLESRSSFEMILRPQRERPWDWFVWDIVGHYAVLGWRGEKWVPLEQMRDMRLNPNKRSFGDNVEPIPDPPQSPPVRDFTEKFLVAAPPWPELTDESVLLQTYESHVRAAMESVYLARLALLGSPADRFIRPQPGPALPLLAVRSARRGMLEAPTLPDAALTLAFAYSAPNFDCALPLSSQDRAVIVAAMFERYFAHATPEQLLAEPLRTFQAANLLVRLHVPPPTQGQAEHRLDLALAVLKKWRYVVSNAPALQRGERAQAQLKGLDAEIKQLDEQCKAREAAWSKGVDANVPRVVRLGPALQQYGLYQKSLDELSKMERGGGAPPLEERVLGKLYQVKPLLLTGQPERAQALVSEVEKSLRDDPALQNHQEIGELLGRSRLWTSMVLGRFSTAIELLHGQIEFQQASIDHLERVVQPQAIAMHIARGLSRMGGLPLDDVLLEAYRRLGDALLEQYYVARGFRGQPIVPPLYEEFTFGFIRREHLILGHEQLRLAKLYLEQGDNANALKWFEAARKSRFVPVVVSANSYLNLMKRNR